MTLYLHAGTNKTGTTSLQQTLAASRPFLAQNGYDYPRLDEGPEFNHHGLIYALKRSTDAFARTVAGFGAGAAERRLVLSSEVVQNLNLREKKEFVAGIIRPGEDVRVVVYLRHPVDWAASAAQQAIKMRSRTYDEVCREPPIYPFRAQLEQWAGVVGRERMVVREFARDALVGGDVVDDVLHQIGAAALIGGITRVKANESITAPAARALSEVCRLARERTQPAGLSLGPLLRMGGPKFALPDWTVGYIQAATQADIAWLAERWGIAFDNAPRWTPEPDILAATMASMMFTLQGNIARARDGTGAGRPARERASPAD